jgi:hypothetical protein
MRKDLSAVALAGALMIVGAGSASALEDTGYPSVGPVCETGSGTVQPNAPFDVDCSGFAPTTTVNVDVRCVAVGASGAGRVMVTTTTTSSSQGSITWTDSISEEGDCTITASQGDRSGSARVLVKAPASVTTASAGLASTGADPSTLLLGAGGLGALALGTVGIVASRRRAHSES